MFLKSKKDLTDLVNLQYLRIDLTSALIACSSKIETKSLVSIYHDLRAHSDELA
jgi:hypothetical protein